MIKQLLSEIETASMGMLLKQLKMKIEQGFEAMADVSFFTHILPIEDHKFQQ